MTFDPSLTFDEIFEAQVPSYHSLDLGFQYRFSTRPFDGRIGTSISNVYNRVNILRNRYFVDFTTTPESVSLWSQTGLPRVVNVFLELQF